MKLFYASITNIAPPATATSRFHEMVFTKSKLHMYRYRNDLNTKHRDVFPKATKSTNHK